MTQISRRKLSDWAAKALTQGGESSKALSELAAYLVDTKRTREIDLIVRDIEIALSKRGIITAHATVARPLSDQAKSELEQLVRGEYEDAKDVSITESIDESIISGYRLDLPGKTIDATAKSKLAKLESVRL